MRNQTKINGIEWAATKLAASKEKAKQITSLESLRMMSVQKHDTS